MGRRGSKRRRPIGLTFCGVSNILITGVVDAVSGMREAREDMRGWPSGEKVK